MMVPLSMALSDQIRFLLEGLDASNSDSVAQELREFAQYGDSGCILLLKTCLEHGDVYDNEVKNVQLEPAVISLFKDLLVMPNFGTLFCQSVKGEAITDGVLENMSTAFCLKTSEKIAIGLALSDSESQDVRNCGKRFCMFQIEGLLASPSALVSSETIKQILTFLCQCEDRSKHLDTLTHMLHFAPSEVQHTPSTLAPFVADQRDEAGFMRNVDFLCDSVENDFDAVLAEMEKEKNMADMVIEMGYGCTMDAESCRSILSHLSPLTEPIISRIITSVACTHARTLDHQNAVSLFLSATGYNAASEPLALSSWNINILVESIKELAPGTNWRIVMENLDHEGFYIPDEEAFTCLMSIYKIACQDPFPLHAICGSIWKNTEAQLAFLRYALSVSPEVFSFSHSTRQLECLDAVQGLMLPSGVLNHAWFCLDLLDVLCMLAERGYSAAVQSMLAYPVKHCPEVLLLGLAQVNTAYDLVQSEIIDTVFPKLLGNVNRNSVIMQLWCINPSFVLRGILEGLSNTGENTARIVDICHETKILNIVLEMIPFSFAIRLAAAASFKDLIDLEKWLSDNITTYRETFCEECLNYLKEVQLGTSPHDKIHHPMANVYAQTVSSFLKALQVNSRVLSSSALSEEIDKLSVMFKQGILAQNDGISNKTTNISYGDDIELEANSYFKHMFSEQLSVSEMVEMLSRFKDSSDLREQSIFECMINNLFEESRFFPKYPEQQLGIAAVLFGSVIKKQFVTHLTLGIAIRCVLDALRKPADSKMFSFGTKALEQFVNRLDEWPQYCNHILQISHLRGTHPELVTYIEGVLTRRSHGGNVTSVDQLNVSSSVSNVNELVGSNGGHIGQTPASLQLQPRDHSAVDDISKKPSANFNTFTKSLLSSAGQLTTASSIDGVGTQKLHATANTLAMLSSSPGFARSSRGFGSALNIETLVAAAERRESPIEAPSSEAQDKISFIINNISTSNVELKAKELSDVLEEQFYPWFAQYLVMKRASIESNFHEVYLKLVDLVNSKALNRDVVQATYENCKVLLGSNLIKSSSEERSLLKNLGSWLGKLTIGRNQVLRAREIDPKSLIVEAYEKGLMIAVIPFTSKILEPCVSSVAYQPPNPWTMGVLALLVEIYAMPNLKMNLKFDIEVLFKNLGVNMKDVAPTSLLKERVRVVEGNPDFSSKDLSASHPPSIPEDKPAVMSALNQIELPLEVANTSHLGGHSHPMAPYGASSTLAEDDKHAAIVYSDHLPGAQGLLPNSVSQSPYNINQFSTLASIQKHAVINPKIGQMGLHPHFQRVLAHAIDRAVKEIVPSIVQRSVSIAIQTSKDLVIKDYVMETDESRIYNAAHLMVGSLAGSLAHVTCKEPLRAALLKHLDTMLQGVSAGNDVLEAAIVMATNDNLDLGCANIESSAHEKALEMIDSEIAQQISLRRTHRESMGSSMYEASGFARGSMSLVPETLRPKPGRLSATQQRVYEDFGRLWQIQQQTVPAANAAMTGPAPSSNLNNVRQFIVSSGQLNTALYSSGLPNSGLGSIAQPLDIPSEEVDSPSPQMSSVSPNHHKVSDSTVQPHSEIETVVVSPTPSPALDVVPVDSSTAKDSVIPPTTLPLVSTTERIESAISEPLLTPGDALINYDMVAAKLEELVAKGGRETEVQAIVSEVPQIILRCVSRDEAALAVAQKVFNALYENPANSLHVRAHLAILVSIRDVCKLVVKELTTWVMHSESERKLNKDITVGLIRRELLNLAEYNIHMAKMLDGGRNKAVTEFAISLIESLLNEDPRVLSELHSLVDVLAKLAGRPGSPESLQKLVEIARNPIANVGSVSSLMVGKDDTTGHARDRKVPSQSMVIRAEQSHMDFVDADNTGLNEQATMLFAEWFQICELPSTNEATSSSYIMKLHHNGLLKGDDTSDRFFRILLELSVSHCLTSEGMSGSAQQPMSFLAIDIYAKLIFSILKYSPVDQGSNKLFLLPKILAVTVRFIQKDAEEKKTAFNQRPYFRLFINWLSDVSSLDSTHDGVNFQVLTAFANAFHALQPLKVPAFSFGWLELVSHRTFMPKLLNGNSQKGWPHLHRLLIDLFQFMEPFLRNAELGDPIRLLYKGTLRVLLVLLHDFPEFLCDYHFSFCDVIPPSCIQMRNIVLSAFPRNMRLPDPSTPNLKIDLLVEMTHAPRILSEIDAALKLKLMKADVDEYLKTRQESSFLRELKQRLQLSANDASRTGTRYNVPLINSLVLYVGVQAIQQLQARTPPQPQGVNNSILVDAALDIFHTLIMEFDTEGRYLFLNAIANQLRYPNNHTHYFSFILLYLFSETNKEIIQEQITRVLLERLIVNRPHPWGLLITFIELIKNPRYNFWNRSFTRCAPEIEKLFESVSRSCGGPKPVNESITGALSDAVH